MRHAVIVSTARTSTGRAYRGGFNTTLAPPLVTQAIRKTVARSGVNDVLIGTEQVIVSRTDITDLLEVL